MEFDKLYKRDLNGGIRVWWVEADYQALRYRTHSGLEGGAIVCSGWTNWDGPSMSDRVQTLYTKQLGQGRYHRDKVDIDNFVYHKPMLAKTYDGKVRSKPFFMQPKLDGIRCVATSEGLFSRTGKQFTSIPHISRALTSFFEQFPDAILDGELYNHELHNDFNKIVSLVRRGDPSPEVERLVQYHIYDMFSPMRFKGRWNFLGHLGMNLYPVIQVVDTICSVKGPPNPELNDPDRLMADWIEMGFEGMMVRYDTTGYEPGKRSWQLQKRKNFLTEEFSLVGISEGQGNRSGIAGFITYTLPDGRTFKSGIRGDYAYCHSILYNKDLYVGGTGTVRFANWTPNGIPRFPVTIDLQPNGRDD